ncbi:MAG: 50S ribosomal protein L9 [Gammaproteobacteria bacterium]|nr:MAG: 50S ribosomal protein L9 [Gammaproteobacteria bacterium]
MKIILLDNIPKLGNIADIIDVKSGYARNYLIPQKKAMFASKENIEYVEKRKSELAKASSDEVAVAQEKADQINGSSAEIKVQVTEEGTMYGSVGTREISDALSSEELIVDKSNVVLPLGPIKEVGEHLITISFHPEVNAEVNIIISPE